MATCKDCFYRAMCYEIEHYGRDLVTDKPCEMFKTTEDVFEVVRCENCKYKGENIDTSGVVVRCDLRDESPVAVLYDDYCSYGERKGEGK